MPNLPFAKMLPWNNPAGSVFMMSPIAVSISVRVTSPSGPAHFTSSAGAGSHHLTVHSVLKPLCAPEKSVGAAGHVGVGAAEEVAVTEGVDEMSVLELMTSEIGDELGRSEGVDNVEALSKVEDGCEAEVTLDSLVVGESVIVSVFVEVAELVEPDVEVRVSALDVVMDVVEDCG